jgi:hypothetical protein
MFLFEMQSQPLTNEDERLLQCNTPKGSRKLQKPEPSQAEEAKKASLRATTSKDQQQDIVI